MFAIYFAKVGTLGARQNISRKYFAHFIFAKHFAKIRRAHSSGIQKFKHGQRSRP